MTERLQTVWVVAPVGYDEYGIDGVFDSLEAAKASRPELNWAQRPDLEWAKGSDCWESVGADAVRCIGAHIQPEELQTLKSVLTKQRA